MKHIARHMEEVEAAITAEDGDPTVTPLLSPLMSSLVIWITAILVAGLAMYGLLK